MLDDPGWRGTIRSRYKNFAVLRHVKGANRDFLTDTPHVTVKFYDFVWRIGVYANSVMFSFFFREYSEMTTHWSA